MAKSCIPAEGGIGTCCGPPDTSGFFLFPEAPGRPTKAATAVAILCTSSAERPVGGRVDRMFSVDGRSYRATLTFVLRIIFHSQ